MLSVTSSNSAAPSPTHTAFKSWPMSPGFTKNHSKVEKAPIIAQKAPEPLILEHSNRENDAGLVPAPSILPTKHPCNFSGLYFRNLSILIHFDLNPTSINILPPVSFSSSFTWPLFQPPFTVLSIILFEKKLSPFSIIQILGLITTTWSVSFLLLLSLVTISVGYYFWGDEGVAMFEGGTWSSGLWPLSSHHLTHHLTMSRDFVGTYACS